MTRLFQTGLSPSAKEIPLTAENLRVVRDVLRAKTGDEVEIVDGTGLVVVARLLEVGKKKGACEVIDTKESVRLTPQLTLFQGVPKGEKSSWIVQKAVEWGVHRIIFLNAKHSVVKEKEGQVERWIRVAQEALRQSGNPFLPDIAGPLDVSDAIQKYPAKISVLFDENRKDEKLRLPPTPSVRFAVGPEGGWSEAERKVFQEAGFLSAGLGPYVLRTETAALSAIAFIHAHLQ